MRIRLQWRPRSEAQDLEAVQVVVAMEDAAGVHDRASKEEVEVLVVQRERVRWANTCTRLPNQGAQYHCRWSLCALWRHTN